VRPAAADRRRARICALTQNGDTRARSESGSGVSLKTVHVAGKRLPASRGRPDEHGHANRGCPVVSRPCVRRGTRAAPSSWVVRQKLDANLGPGQPRVGSRRTSARPTPLPLPRTGAAALPTGAASTCSMPLCAGSPDGLARKTCPGVGCLESAGRWCRTRELFRSREQAPSLAEQAGAGDDRGGNGSMWLWDSRIAGHFYGGQCRKHVTAVAMSPATNKCRSPNSLPECIPYP